MASGIVVERLGVDDRVPVSHRFLRLLSQDTVVAAFADVSEARVPLPSTDGVCLAAQVGERVPLAISFAPSDGAAEIAIVPSSHERVPRGAERLLRRAHNVVLARPKALELAADLIIGDVVRVHQYRCVTE